MIDQNGALRAPVNGESVVVAEHPFILIIHKHELTASARGLISQIPPVLYASCYNRREDRTEFLPVEWNVADALAPKEMTKLRERIREIRDRNNTHDN